MRWSRGGTAAAAVAAVVLSACSASGDAATDSTEPASGAGSQPSGTTAEAGPTAEAPGPGEGGELVVGAAQGIPQLNPAIRTFAWEQTLFPLLWSGLTRPAEDGTVEPDLAEEWAPNDDGTEWTFRLRPDVTFSNGEDLTAEDVVATFDYYRAPDTATQESGKLTTIESVEATAEDTVTFTLSSPNQWFPDAIQNVKVLDVDSLDSIDTDPAVNGPFQVEEFVPNDRLVLVPNESYWGEPALLERIEIVTQSDPTAAVSALRAGDLDVFWAVPPVEAAAIAGGSDPDLRIVNPNGPGQSPFWNVDTSAPPFDDVRARQALAYAIDRETILEVAYSGQGVVSPSNNFISTDSPWYSEGPTDYSYDLDRAAELFAEAGITEGDTLTWWGVSNQYPEWNTTGQILQQSLAEIGIELQIENREIGTWAAEFFPAGKSYPGLIVPNFLNNPVSPAFALSYYDASVCVCNWESEEFASAYADALAAPADPEGGLEAWAEVQTVLNEEVPMLVPLQASTGSAVRQPVQGVWLEAGSVLHLEQAWVSD